MDAFRFPLIPDSFPATPRSDLLLGGSNLKDFDDPGAPAFMREPHASSGGNRSRFVSGGYGHVDICETPRVVPVSLFRSSGTTAPVGSYLVEMPPESGVIALEEYILCDGRQGIPLVGCGVIQPSETLGVSAAPLIRTPLRILDWQLPEPDSGDEDSPPPSQDELPRPLVGSVNIAPSLDP